ncbi:MAG: hypothetical protein M0Z28_27175 [Rhodospirillales bacterium]|nr:hypothetical protein [Rhodospirillales bacterium]
MTGWRVGWMVLSEDLARPVERLVQNLFIRFSYCGPEADMAAAAERLHRWSAGAPPGRE